MKKTFGIVFVLIGSITILCAYLYIPMPNVPKGVTIYVIPVYGQSNALGEETSITTNLDSLKMKYRHRIRTSELDEQFGYFDGSITRQRIKRMIGYSQHSHETSCYALASQFVEWLNQQKDSTSLVCCFEAGQGETGIDGLLKGSAAYNKLLWQIENIHCIAQQAHCQVRIPAFCWIQGENDVVWDTGENYGEKLAQFRKDLEKDINRINQTQEPLFCVLNQTSCLAISKYKYNPNAYDCPQLRVPMNQLNLILTDSMFVAGLPTYPFTIQREYVHLDANSQYALGRNEADAIISLLQRTKRQPIHPKALSVNKDTISLTYSTPILLDTINVSATPNWGFCVISPNDTDLLNNVSITNDTIIKLTCNHLQTDVKVRYGVNGIRMKSGRQNGPRGNIRDVTLNWGFIFEYNIKK